MPYLLNLAYVALLIFLLPRFLYVALRTGKYREGFGEKFLGRVPNRDGHKSCIWIHAVSVGEVNLIATLLEKIRSDCPDTQCVVSTTTKTGYDLARRRYSDLEVFYCPLDFTWSTRTAMRRIRPDLLVLAELELWPNLIGAAKLCGAKIAVVNGRLSDHSFRGYRKIRPVFASVLRKIDLIAAGNEQYADRFRDLGARPESVHVTGSLKFDGAQSDRNNSATQHLRQLAGIDDHDIVFLVGSTQDPEESTALSVFRRLSIKDNRLRLILVPRHPERFDAVAAILDASGMPWQRRSRLDSENPSEARILLVDAIGELGAWWGTAQIAFVGGSLTRRGGQNMIEPAAYGAAVSFGPNTWNFREVVATMLASDAAQVIHDELELFQFVERCLDDPSYGQSLGRNAQALVQSQLGASQRTVDHLITLLDRRPSSRPALPAA